MKVRDLVTPQSIQAVIQLDHFDPKAVLESYVLTQEGAELLTSKGGFLSRILAPAASGLNSFIVLGNYGSGKSHLLAFVDTVLTHPELWNLERHPQLESVSALREARSFTVKLKLSETRLSLDRLLVRAMRDGLGRLGIANPYADWWGTVEQVNRDYRENADFLEFLAAQKLSETMWDRRVRDHDDKLFHFAELFLRSRGFETQLQVGAADVVRLALERLSEHPDYGPNTVLVLLLDELSDFILSKEGSGEGHYNDLIFLRDLGEASSSMRFRMLAAVQSDLLDPNAPLSDKVRPVVQKMAQRFQRTPLVSQYLHAVVRERVLLKTPAQRAEVSKLYLELRRRLPEYREREETFVDLYPVGTQVLDIFQQLVARGFLANRSILSYLAEEVARPEFLDGEADSTFLTPDRLYAGLKLELSGHAQLSRLTGAFDKALDILERSEAKSNEAKDAARRCLAALVVFEAAGLEPTLEDLINSVQFAISAKDTKMVYGLPNAVLKNLIKGGAPLKVRRGEHEKTVYALVTDLASDQSAKMQQLKAGIGARDPRLRELVFEKLGLELGLVPDHELLKQGKWDRSVMWKDRQLSLEGTVRKLEAGEAPIAQPDKDFTLYIGSALETGEGSSVGEGAALWRPDPLNDDELDAVRELTAWRGLQKSLRESDPSAASGLTLFIAESEKRVMEAVQRAYFDTGALEGLEVSLSAAAFARGAVSGRLPDMVDRLFEGYWTQLYPQAPRLGQLNWSAQHVSQLVREFLPHAELGLDNPKTNLKTVLDALALPTIAQESGGTYRLDPEKPFVRALEIQLKSVDSKLGLPYNDALELLTAAPYGLPRELVPLVVAVLVAQQKIVLVGKGNMVFSAEDLGKLDFKKVDFLKSTGVTERRLEVEKLLKSLGLEGVSLSGVSAQNEVWRRFGEHLAGLLPDTLGSTLEELPMDTGILRGKLQDAQASLLPARRIVEAHPGDAKGGLEALLTAYPAPLEVKLSTLETEVVQLERLGYELRNKGKYLTEEIRLPEIDRDALLERLAQASTLEDAHQWLEAFEEHQTRYIGAYLHAHNAARGDGLDWAALEGVSWPLLEAARGLTRVRPSPDADALERSRTDALRQRCTRLTPHDLKIQARCPHCHFSGDLSGAQKEVNPLALAQNLKEQAQQSTVQLRQHLLEQQDTINRNLKSVGVSEETRHWLSSLFAGDTFAGATLEGLTPALAREIDSLLDSETRFITVSLSQWTHKLEGRLKGQNLTWADFTTQLEAMISELRPPEAKSHKLRVQVEE